MAKRRTQGQDGSRPPPALQCELPAWTGRWVLLLILLVPGVGSAWFYPVVPGWVPLFLIALPIVIFWRRHGLERRVLWLRIVLPALSRLIGTRRCLLFRIGLPLLPPLLYTIAKLTGVGYGLLSLMAFPTGWLVALVAAPFLYSPYPQNRSYDAETVIIMIAVMGQWTLIGYGIDRLVERGLAEEDTRRCPQCGYDIRGLPEPRCPECGGAIKLYDDFAPPS